MTMQRARDLPGIAALFPSHRDFSMAPLKPDHQRRPMWVCANGRIFLDKSSPIYQKAYDFLIAISEPICRPEFIHEYTVTSFSLYAAASLGLSTYDILRGLDKMSKNHLDKRLEDFIRNKTLRCGKVKMLLKHHKYYVESLDPAVLAELLKDPVIASARIDNKSRAALGLPPSTTSASAAAGAATGSSAGASGQFGQESKQQQQQQGGAAGGAARPMGATMANAAALGYVSADVLAKQQAQKRRFDVEDPQFKRRVGIAAGDGSLPAELTVDAATGLLVEKLESEAEEVLYIPGTGGMEDVAPAAAAIAAGAGRAAGSEAGKPVAAQAGAAGAGAGAAAGATAGDGGLEGGKRRRLDRADARRAMGVDDDDDGDVDMGGAGEGGGVDIASASAAAGSRLKGDAWEGKGDDVVAKPKAADVPGAVSVAQVREAATATATLGVKRPREADSGSAVAAAAGKSRPNADSSSSSSSSSRAAEVAAEAAAAAAADKGPALVPGPEEGGRRVEPRRVYSFEVHASLVEAVRRAAAQVGYPMLEEYDFRRDRDTEEEKAAAAAAAAAVAAAGAAGSAAAKAAAAAALTNPHVGGSLPIKLRPSAQIRDYQEKALSKMFGNGRARSGIIVLPCGAGKTLVGITAMATLCRSCLIFCTTAVAVEQWRRQIKQWSQLPDEYVYAFTRGSKTVPRAGPKVVITTYSMVAYEQKRGPRATEVMHHITQHEWGLVLLDEVHVAPADKFQKCVSVTHSRCKLGLTATLVREDDKIEDLTFLIGPKLYEANWLDLQARGFIATVRCVEVWCPMTSAFYKEYLMQDHRKQQLLYVTNPSKYRAMEALVRKHEARGDKTMIFSDNVCALRLFSKILGRPAIYGDTPEDKRLEILRDFSERQTQNTIFISKVGDNSIDLPDTNVIIQISSHYSSRRQEAQRLGRITRPKSKASGSLYDAYFYTLVSCDTSEMVHAARRQRFLVDQGYSYKVLKQHQIEAEAKEAGYALGYSRLEDQAELLKHVMSSTSEQLEDERERDDGAMDDEAAAAVEGKARGAGGSVSVSKSGYALNALTGAGDRVYAEVAKPKGSRK